MLRGGAVLLLGCGGPLIVLLGIPVSPPVPVSEWRELRVYGAATPGVAVRQVRAVIGHDDLQAVCGGQQARWGQLVVSKGHFEAGITATSGREMPVQVLLPCGIEFPDGRLVGLRPGKGGAFMDALVRGVPETQTQPTAARVPADEAR